MEDELEDAAFRYCSHKHGPETGAAEVAKIKDGFMAKAGHCPWVARDALVAATAKLTDADADAADAADAAAAQAAAGESEDGMRTLLSANPEEDADQLAAAEPADAAEPAAAAGESEEGMRSLIAAAREDEETVRYATQYVTNMAELLQGHQLRDGWLETSLRNAIKAVIKAAVLAVRQIVPSPATIPYFDPSAWLRLGVLVQKIHALENPPQPSAEPPEMMAFRQTMMQQNIEILREIDDWIKHKVQGCNINGAIELAQIEHARLQREKGAQQFIRQASGKRPMAHAAAGHAAGKPPPKGPWTPLFTSRDRLAGKPATEKGRSAPQGPSAALFSRGGKRAKHASTVDESLQAATARSIQTAAGAEQAFAEDNDVQAAIARSIQTARDEQASSGTGTGQPPFRVETGHDTTRLSDPTMYSCHSITMMAAYRVWAERTSLFTQSPKATHSQPEGPNQTPYQTPRPRPRQAKSFEELRYEDYAKAGNAESAQVCTATFATRPPNSRPVKMHQHAVKMHQHARASTPDTLVRPSPRRPCRARTRLPSTHVPSSVRPSVENSLYHIFTGVINTCISSPLHTPDVLHANQAPAPL